MAVVGIGREDTRAPGQRLRLTPEADGTVAPGLRVLLRFAALCIPVARIFARFLRWQGMCHFGYRIDSGSAEGAWALEAIRVSRTAWTWGRLLAR